MQQLTIADSAPGTLATGQLRMVYSRPGTEQVEAFIECDDDLIYISRTPSTDEVALDFTCARLRFVYADLADGVDHGGARVRSLTASWTERQVDRTLGPADIQDVAQPALR